MGGEKQMSLQIKINITYILIILMMLFLQLYTLYKWNKIDNKTRIIIMVYSVIIEVLCTIIKNN